MDKGKPPRRWRSVVGWNVLFLSLCATLLVIDWKSWIQPRAPFTETRLPTRFVPGVGLLNEPGAEVRWTNRNDFWVAQRANRWGFLDREPPTPEQAARTCHIAFIGDSFVEALEVPVADKFQVRLEELAARALPRLNITTSAYGRAATGQINQLPFYDAYARRLGPKLVVLVFVHNDFRDNHRLLAGIAHGWDPDSAPYVFAEKTAPGAIALRPPDPAWRMLPIATGPTGPTGPLEYGSRVLCRLQRNTGCIPGAGLTVDHRARLRIELLAQRPRYQSILEASNHLRAKFPDPPTPLSMEAMEFTAFALDEFQWRVAADGASLWLFLALGVTGAADPLRVFVEDLAEARGIPVVSMHDYLVRQGRKIREGIFPRDGHWTPTGHQWAAEAVLERLRQHPEVCGV